MSRGGVEVWVDATEEVIASEEIHSTTVMETTDTPIQKLLDTMVHEGDGFFDDGFYCNECRSMFQHQHLTDPNAINGPSFILDSPTIMGGPQRALLSLPHGLMIARSSIPNAGLGVVNQGPTVSPGMHFGPYEGEMASRLDAMGSEYSWEICRGKDKWEYIDGASEMHSNWMRYVNCARNDQEKNLLAVQYKDSVMFHCCRTIQQGDELLVWPSQTLLDHLSPAWNQIWFMKQTPTQTSASSGMGSHNFTCDQCQLPFTTETYLQRHTDFFHAPPPEKKEVAATADDVSVVILNVDDVVGGVVLQDDSAEKGKLCADCGKTFKYDHHLARHQRCVHSNKRPYCCPLCRRSFSQASGLLRHQLVHKKVTSSVIRAGGADQSHTTTTTTVYQLDRSQDNHHTEHDDPEMGGGGGLDDDHMDHDGGDVVMEDSPDEEHERQQQEEETPAKKTRQKKIADNLCTECGKSFTHQGYLKKHKLTVHNGVRPYVCTVCRKSFGQHHDLARHLKAHNVKRSHKRSGFWCAPCILTFCTEDSLRHHTNLVHPECQEVVVGPPAEVVGVGGGDAVVIDAQDPDGNAVNAMPIAVIALPEGDDGALPDDAHPVAVLDDDVDEPVIDDDQGDDPDFVVDPSEAKEAEEAEEESLPKRRPQRLGARSKVAAITKRIAPKRKGGRRKKAKKGEEEEEEEEEEEVEESNAKGKKPRKWYICDQCKTTYGSQKELKTHKCAAANTKHVCAQCGMEFKKAGFLKRHEKTVHKDGVESTYSCDQCLKVFKKLSNLKSHQKSKRCERHHCTSELFPCDFCEFSFTLKSYLRKHLRRHHPVEFISSPHNETDEQPGDDDPDNPHLCPHCGKTYVSTKHFKAHSCFQELRVVFLCTDCGKGFSNHYGLKQHQRIHTGEKPYKCPHCGKGFSYVGQLNVHIRTHTGEKPYLCTHCGESFRQSGDLKRHERKHTGVKPHNCPNCFKSFSRLQSLKAHQMLHLGQRKFKCTQCPRSFSRNYHLRRHHQKMHS